MLLRVFPEAKFICLINHYGKFYRTKMFALLRRINTYRLANGWTLRDYDCTGFGKVGDWEPSVVTAAAIERGIVP
jgi:hypothetical protein